MSATGEGRVSLVTGGTGGIGRDVALQLARGGDRVIFVGRSARRGARVLEELREARPGVDHAFLPADLALLSETARVADEVGRLTDRLDAAVFCAGVLSTVPEWTAEGLERNFVLNYLTRYLLARRLLPALEEAPSGRLVLVSNAGMYGDTLDLDDLQHRRGGPGLRVAGRTQFANDLLCVELAERLRGTRVEATCVFPGLTDTDVFRNARGLPRIARALAPLVLRLAASPPEPAARTPVFLAQDARAAGTGGVSTVPSSSNVRSHPARTVRIGAAYCGRLARSSCGPICQGIYPLAAPEPKRTDPRRKVGVPEKRGPSPHAPVLNHRRGGIGWTSKRRAASTRWTSERWPAFSVN